MKNLIIIIIIAAIGYYFLNNRKSQCETIEDVKNKGLELTQAFIHAATAKDPKISADTLMQKIKKVEIMKENGFPNIQESCAAMDEIIDYLE